MGNEYQLLLIRDAEGAASKIEDQLDKLDLNLSLDVIHQKKDLKDQYPDLIISDLALSESSGMKAFQHIRETYPDLPFILITDDLDEDRSIELMLEGASDVVMKDRLERLRPAVTREIQNYEQRKKREKKLSDSLQRYQSLVQSVEGIVWEADAETFEFYYVSPQSKQILGYTPSQWYQKETFWKDHIHPDDRDEAVKYCHHKSKQGENHTFEYRMLKADGGIVWLRDYVTVVKENGEPSLLRGLMVDITETKFLSEIESLEKKLLTLAAQKSSSLQDVMDYFINGIEVLFPRMIPSILKVKNDRVYHWAASARLPDRYLNAIDGEQIGPNAGSCGTAAYFNDKVIASDIDTDPRWERYKQVALRDDLKACWSQALADSAGKVVGTFAIYYSEPKEPTEFEEKVIDRAKNILQILIENKQSEKALEKNQKLLDKAYQLADIGHWELDLEADQLFWSESIKKLHEVDLDYKPDLDAAISFYKEGENQETIKKVVQRAIEKGDSFDVELEIITAKGSERWVRAVGETKFEDGECVKLFGSTQDITERKVVELKHRDTKQKLRDVVEYSTNMFYRHNAQHVLSYVSPQSKEFLGYEPEEAMKRWTEFVTDHPINQEGFEKTQQAIETGRSQQPFELELKKKDGEKIWVRVNEAPIVEDGETVAIVGSLTDITERKKYEEKLEQLSLVASKTTDIIIITDAEDRITWVNDAFKELTGYTAEESIGKVSRDLLQGPETNPKTAKRIDEAVQKGQPIQEVVLNYTKSEEKFWLDITVDPIYNDNGKLEGFIGVEKNVTEQIERKKELQESAERYEIVSKATSDTIWDLDLEADINRYNSNIYGMFGYQKHEVEEAAQWWRDRIHPEDRQRVLQKMDEALSSNKDRFQLEYRFQSADGTYKFIYDRAFIVTDENDNPTRMIGAMQDITKQKSEKKWLKLFESAISNTTESVAILESGSKSFRDKKILYVNDAFMKMTGYSWEEVVGQNLEILIGPNTNPDALADLDEALEKGVSVEAEFVNYKKNGDEFWIRISMAPVKDSEGLHSHWICVGRNITDRRRRETELRDSLNEKEILLMEIHHRVKNNLAVVSGMMQLQAFEADNESLKQKLFDSVVRIKTMGSIHELLYKSESFSKLQLDENIKQLISIITDTFKTNVDLELGFNLEEVELNINQAIPCSLIVNEVVTNVLKHAYDAGQTGQLEVVLSEKGDMLHLNIKDNGRGLPKDFATNDTSLGFKLIETLSNQLEADFAYESTNQGTTFQLSFKRAEVKGIGSAHLNSN